MKERRNGFTLIELLVVIIILAAVSLLLVPTVLDAIDTFKGNSYEDQIKIIETAAQTWGTDHLYALEFYEGDTATITLGQLKGEGYLDYQFLDPTTKKNFPDDMTITVTRKGKKLRFHVNSDTGTTTKYSGDDQPRLTLRGDVVQYVELGDTYVDPGVDKKNTTKTPEITYAKNGSPVSAINTVQAGTYTITYKVSNDNTSTTIMRTVIVK